MSSFTRLLGLAGLFLLAACHGKHGGGGGAGGTPPSGLSYPNSPVIHVVDVPAEADAPNVTGAVDSYSASPALPAGLTLDPATGAISGTPSEVSARRTFTITASNAAGSTTFELDLAVAPAPRHAYAVSSLDSTITVLRVDAASGALVPSALVPPPAGAAGAERIYVDPAERFVYVVNEGSHDVSAFAIDPTNGWLEHRSSSPLGAGPHRLAFLPDASALLATSRDAGELAILAIDGTSGALSALHAPLAIAGRPTDVAVDRGGRFAFVALAGDETTGAGAGVQAYAIDPATRALTAVGAPLDLAGAHPTALCVAPAQDALYVTLGATDEVLRAAFDPASGALAPASTYVAGDLPRRVALDPLERFAFVVNESSADISSYVVESASGALVPAGSTPVAQRPAVAVTDVAGRFLYVVDEGASELVHYAVAPASGALEQRASVALRPGTSDLVLVGGPRTLRRSTALVHVVNAGSGDVSPFRIDAQGLPVATLPTSVAGVEPFSIAVHARLPFAYVADRGGHALKTDAVEPFDGTLTPLGPAVALAGEPWSVAIEPSGRFLYLVRRSVVVTDDGWLSVYAIDPASGLVSLVQELEVHPRPTSLAIDPLGRCVYVASIGGTSFVQPYRIDVLTGAVASSGAPAPAPGVSSLAFHPTGRWMYAVLRSSNVVVQYELDALTGEATPVVGGSRAGREPTSLAFTPDGRFAYVSYNDALALETGGHIGLFPVDATGHLVTPAPRFLEGLHTSSVAVDARGAVLYATNEATNDLTTLSIDPASGALTVIGNVATGLAPRAIATTTHVE